MGKMEETLRQEITRLARKEVNAAVGPLSRRILGLKRTVSQLRKAVDKVGGDTSAPARVLSAREALPKASQADVNSARILPGTIRSLRLKLGLTQTSLAVLLGVTPAAVQLWEQGRSQPRGRNKAGIVAVRSLGRREVKKILAEKGVAPSKRRLSVPPPQKGAAATRRRGAKRK